MRKSLALLPAVLALTGCATASNANDGLAWAAIGERVFVDGPYVTPLAVIEDSRCPANVRCVWAGRLKIRARIHLGSGDRERELTLGEPVQIADGSLEFTEARPISTTSPITPADYRFGFRFMGGI